MQQLKEKIQVVIGEMNGELSSYESGYKQCLINIQNDIDLQMMAMEKEQKKFMFDCGRQYQLTGEGTFTEVYNETYDKDSTPTTHPMG